VFEFRIRVNKWSVGREKEGASEKGEDLKAEGSLLNIRTGRSKGGRGFSLVERVCVCEREETLALKATNASPHQSVYFVGDQRDASVSEFTRRRSKRRLARMRRD